MLSLTQSLGTTCATPLAIAVIGPDNERRKAIASALGGSDDRSVQRTERHPAERSVQEFCSYPPELDELPRMLALCYDVVFIDLDSDTEYALDAVGSISARNSATVMVYSTQADRELVIQCMRAGAREFLNLPLTSGDMTGAMARVPVRDTSIREFKDAGQKLWVFLGSKGGCGVTTIASSFAVSLAQDSGQSTLLIDLGFPLGDAAIQLGMACDYSTSHALEDWNRLDGNFLRSLLAEHESGLWVLGAPGEFPRTQAPLEAIDRLLRVARQNFRYVVVDIGSRVDLVDSALFGESANLYLVTQVGISELRNANRLITQFFPTCCHKLQVVLNRYMSHALGFDEESVAKALTRPAQWKIPDEDATGRRAQHTISELAQEESPISKAIRRMARAACGLPALEEKRKIFSLF
jgi:pilus assembly protein CpaE